MDSDLKAAWYCVRSQIKHEHIAAGHLRQSGIETFLPRISFKRVTAQGPKWVTEALFPNYLFARFDLTSSLRLVHHSPGVSKVVRFGAIWPNIPDSEIELLRTLFQDDSIHVISPEIEPGHEVQITQGAFQGLRAVVTRVMPSRERVRILLEFLGRQTEAEVSASVIVRTENPRHLVQEKDTAVEET
jgi:transcriptional antiterminator RfaH